MDWDLGKEICGMVHDTTSSVALFRRLKAQEYTIDVDNSNLNKFEYSSVPVWIQEEGQSVLSWVQREHAWS